MKIATKLDFSLICMPNASVWNHAYLTGDPHDDQETHKNPVSSSPQSKLMADRVSGVDRRPG